MPRVNPPPPGNRPSDITFPSGTGPVTDGSGMVPTSGSIPAGSSTLGQYAASGPWFIETQSLDFDYVRVPRGKFAYAETTLSSCDATMFHQSTALQVRVTARYGVEKSYDDYNTSSWVQTQKFEVIAASADASGTVYGSGIGGLGASALGPAGSVLTKQEWYNRRPWQGGDASGNKSMNQVYNYAAMAENWFPAGTSSVVDANFIFGDFNATFITPGEPGALVGTKDPHPAQDYYVYWLTGGYSMSQEQATFIYSTINHVGAYVKGGYALYEALPADLLDKATPIPEYDTNRHDFLP